MSYAKWSVVFIIVSSLLVGCNRSDTPVIPVTQLQQATEQPVMHQAPAYTKPITPEEYDGYVYKGILHKELRDSGYGWSLIEIAKAFGIPIVELVKPEEYKDSVIPYGFRVGNNVNALSITLDTSNKVGLNYLKSKEGADAAYSVKQYGHFVQMQTPLFVHHGSTIQVQPIEILQLLDIDYAQEGQTIIVDGADHTRMNGKVLFDGKVRFGNEDGRDVQLNYQYDPVTKPNYDNVELKVDGQSIILFDRDHRGSSNYYQNGYVEEISFQNNTLLKIALDEDVVLLLKAEKSWQRVFSPDQYHALSSNFTLLVDGGGMGTLHDSFHQTEHKVSIRNGLPNTNYPLTFMSFGHFEMDEGQKELAVTADLMALNQGRSLFNMQIRFTFDGATFVPKHVKTTDIANFGVDKTSGKTTKSLDGNIQFQFSYDW